MATPSVDSCWGQGEGRGAFQRERGHDAGPQCHTNGSSLKCQPQTPHLNLRHRPKTVYTVGGVVLKLGILSAQRKWRAHLRLRGAVRSTSALPPWEAQVRVHLGISPACPAHPIAITSPSGLCGSGQVTREAVLLSWGGTAQHRPKAALLPHDNYLSCGRDRPGGPEASGSGPAPPPGSPRPIICCDMANNGPCVVSK